MTTLDVPKRVRVLDLGVVTSAYSASIGQASCAPRPGACIASGGGS